MNTSFQDSLKNRTLELENIFISRGEKNLRLLASGGSTSIFMLYSFLTYSKKILPIEVTYLQFDNFNWLERENLRQLVKKLNLNYRELPISEKDLVADSEWIDKKIRFTRVWSFIDKKLSENFIAGLGWPCYLRVSNDLTAPGATVYNPQLVLNHISSFYNPDLWQAFIKFDSTELFFNEWKRIPFDSIRYWQDFSFKKIFLDFPASNDWKLENTL